ncbi:hypothetical protein A1O3_02618 [Capronia epimyces CBS 606.96]|uniref:CHY-type domain-containing protein n=1 Tax=Capronia epimyces CBS 606.96 TaxID=1182542 RepID=W9YJX5_9EURO|nr:uncharacterized protein A1O3_02618 [Capronia epimyces CBS 606.96]EXJ89551.1 hypothetical protein A1O3_02618 [Capronia epimyces CBS 606.96]
MNVHTTAMLLARLSQNNALFPTARGNPSQNRLRLKSLSRKPNAPIHLALSLKPSDPDFPFELDGLQCTLTVPTSYPGNGAPTIRVTNAEMARGYQINVERGFDSLVERSPGKTLLALLNDLDKNLEKFLTAERAKTIKIVVNANKSAKVPNPVDQAAPNPIPPPTSVIPPPPAWTQQQTADALAKRQADIRQLEARMGHVSGFSRSSDGTRFNIPVQLANSGKLPLPLQRFKEVTLIVPKMYNLEHCTVQLKGVTGTEAENVVLGFSKHAQEHPNMTLMAHINYLIQSIHTMASEAVQKATLPLTSSEPQHPPSEQPTATLDDEETEPEANILDPERPHIKVIPRPPEWNRHHSQSESESESESSYASDDFTGSEAEEEEEDEDEEQAEQGGATLPASSTSSEKGIILFFPNLEIYNIELLALVSLSLSVKCLRCKSPLDIANIKPNNTTDSTNTPTLASSVRAETCLKCTTPFTISYTSNLLHANSVRAGTLEVTGCTIADMLPSVFQPTCSSCSTTFPVPPGMISVRGDTPIQVCRACHAKMTFTIPEVKFLRVSHPTAALPLRRPKKESLGISAGTALPRNGACSHYRHSYRWFRFGCCGRVYACDRCHDAAEAHVNEHADRMICGWCSREQRFRTEDCGVCGKSVIRRRKGAAGFWEGGKGTRDRGLMSRKERRKYRRPPGGTLPAKKKTKGGK